MGNHKAKPARTQPPHYGMHRCQACGNTYRPWIVTQLRCSRCATSKVQA